MMTLSHANTTWNFAKYLSIKTEYKFYLAFKHFEIQINSVYPATKIKGPEI